MTATETVSGRTIPRHRGKPVRHRLRFYGAGNPAYRLGGLIAECDAGDFRTTIDGGHTAAELARLNRQHNGKP